MLAGLRNLTAAGFALVAVLMCAEVKAMPMSSSSEPSQIDRLLAHLGFDLPKPAQSAAPPVTLVSARQDWAYLTPDLSCHTRTPIRIGQKSYKKGLGAHANGLAVFRLRGEFKRFAADVGVDNNYDTAGGKGSVQFEVRIDGRSRVKTRILRGGEPAVPLDLDLNGAASLELEVTDAGDGISYDQADWADAKVIDAQGTVTYLSDIVAAQAHSPLLSAESLPSSFVLDGQSSDRLLLQWPRKDTIQPGPAGSTLYQRAWSKPDGSLRATWSARVWPERTAMEIRWTFANLGARPSDLLSEVFALDLAEPWSTRRVRVVHSTGGLTGGMEDADLGFAVASTPLGSVTLSGAGGRSSNKDLPFFLIHDDAASAGLFVGVGWSGQWQADIGTKPGGPLTARVCMPGTHLRIPAGETVISPSVLIGTYNGDPLDGGNALRRALRNHYVPLLGNAKPLPPLSWNSWFVLENRIDEEVLKQEANVAAQLGLEYLCIDAGWFDGDFPNGVGNWTLNHTKFPHGLKPIGDYAREKGLKLGLWFEPERADASTRLAKEHPGWVHGGLVDLGNPECREWVFRMMTGFIDEGGVRWIRFDFNMDPLPSWDAMATSETQGLAQIRHIEGLYELLDRLMKRYPDLLIEGCASGGRRIDLETIQRSHTFWKSDDTARLPVMRFHETGGNAFLPGGLLNTNLLAISSAFDVRGLFAGPLGLGADLTKLPPETVTMLKAEIARYLEIRPLLNADYFPLFAQGRDESGWIGWEFNAPERGEGVAIVLRPAGSTYRSADVHLRGLSADQSYEVSRSDSDKKERMTGRALAAQVIELASPGATLLLRYHRVD